MMKPPIDRAERGTHGRLVGPDEQEVHGERRTGEASVLHQLPLEALVLRHAFLEPWRGANSLSITQVRKRLHVVFRVRS